MNPVRKLIMLIGNDKTTDQVIGGPESTGAGFNFLTG